MKQIEDISKLPKRIKVHINFTDIVKDFILKTKSKVTASTVSSIIKGFNNHIIDEVIEGHVVSFPEKTGVLSIKGRKTTPVIDDEGKVRGMSVDWKSTRELWKKNTEAKKEKTLAFFFNENTDGIRYKFNWSKTGVFISNREFYSLKLARATKKKLVRAINEGKEYICEN